MGSDMLMVGQMICKTMRGAEQELLSLIEA